MDNPTATVIATAPSPTATVVATAISPIATVVATAISPRREPWGELTNTNGSPGRGDSESDATFATHGNRCRPYRGWDRVFVSTTHGSRRGLIAVAPTGAENRQTGKLEQWTANNVAKLLEAAS